jgi:flagellar biosynthesis protein FliR
MYENWLILFALVFARVAGLTMTAPIYGTSDVPMQVRVLVAVALSLLIAPLEWHSAAVPYGSLANLVMMLGVETAVGACLGLGVLVVLHSMTLAGEMVAQASGLGIAEMFDPTIEENVSSFARLMFLTATTIFLCIGGHRMVMAGLLDTFQTIPPGSGTFSGTLADGFTTLVGMSFSLGVRIAAPVVTALLLATLVLGLIGRTLPQLNIFALGFSLNALLAFAALGLTFGAAGWAFQDQIAPALQTIFDTLKTPLKMEWMS